MADTLAACPPARLLAPQLKHWGTDGLKEGDVLVSNHPQLAGGSHLPDITVITPVFNQGKGLARCTRIAKVLCSQVVVKPPAVTGCPTPSQCPVITPGGWRPCDTVGPTHQPAIVHKAVDSPFPHTV